MKHAQGVMEEAAEEEDAFNFSLNNFLCRTVLRHNCIKQFSFSN